jgi:hypothetical protein
VRNTIGAVLLAAATLVACSGGGDDDAGPTTTTVAPGPQTTLPPVEGDATLAYLEGAGAALLEFRAVTDPVRTAGDAERRGLCQGLIAEELPAVAPDVDALGALAKLVPDPVTQQLVVNDTSARLALLEACVAEAPASSTPEEGGAAPSVEEAAADVDETSAALDARLEQLEADR